MWGTRFPNWMTCATLRNGKMENCLRPVAEVKSELQALKLDTFLFDLGGVLVNDLDLNYDTSIRIFKMLGKRAFTLWRVTVLESKLWASIEENPLTIRGKCFKKRIQV